MAYCSKNNQQSYCATTSSCINNCNTGCCPNNCPPIPGPPGPAGPMGPAGSRGPAGPMGPAGSAGTAGPAGIAGATGPAGIAGPAGSTGPTGPVGTITGSVESVADLPDTGNQGDSYLVNGTLYVWDQGTESWISMGNLNGPTGPTGPGGDDGADGIIGQIDAVVREISDLPTTGAEEGTIYYVEENDGLYVWDDTIGEWIMVDVAQGPRGATGPTGPQGEDGIIGQINGVVETKANLPTTGVDQGTIFYVEDEDAVYVWDSVNGWTALGMIQGPRGATGPTGPTGPVGTILGSYETLADLEREHPTGNQGDAYLVDGILYVWDVESNSWKAVGNLRPAAESIAIIPFASQIAPRTYVNGGVPARVSLIGFGYGDYRDQAIIESYSFAVNSDNTFVLEGDNDNFQVVFSLPFDMIIDSIALTTGNWAEYYPTGTVFPYVQLYAAAPTSNNFMPIEGAAAIPETGHGPGTVPSNTMLYALKENINGRLRAGTRIAIGALARIDGDTTLRDYYLYFTGGIGMTRWVE